MKKPNHGDSGNRINRGQAKKLAAIMTLLITAIITIPNILQPEPWPNVAPTSPCLTGPAVAHEFSKVDFVAMSQDENDSVSYTIFWGDGLSDDITLPGGEYWHMNHSWTFQGKYIIQVKAVDSAGNEAVGCMRLINVI